MEARQFGHVVRTKGTPLDHVNKSTRLSSNDIWREPEDHVV